MSEFAGSLRERVVQMRRGPERDALGGAAGLWSVIDTLWAAIVPDGIGPLDRGDAVSAAGRWRVTLRSPSAVKIDDRLKWEGRALRVRGLIADPRTPDRILVMAEEER